MDMNVIFDDKPLDHRKPACFQTAVSEVWECHVFLFVLSGPGKSVFAD